MLVPPLIPSRIAAIYGGLAITLKVALTDCAALMVTVQVPKPEHAPDQPAKTDARSVETDKVTIVPVAKFAAQVAPQLIPAGLEVTVPESTTRT